MNPGLYSQTMRSEQVVYGLGATFPVKLDFLANARQMAVPEVTKLTWVLEGTMDTTGAGGTTALGADYAKLYDTIRFFDEAEMIKASGAMLRLLRQVELGSKATDPADQNNAVSAQSNELYRHEIYFKPLDNRHCRPKDFTVPLENFLDGGTLEWSTPAAVPTGFGPVNANWRVRVEAEVEDARVKELKSRRRIFDQVVQNQDFEYSCGGSIRHAILASKLTTTGYTDLSGFLTIFSRTLNLPPNFKVSGLLNRYRQDAEAVGANDNYLTNVDRSGANGMAPGTAIPMVFPRRYQRIGKMIDAKTFHIDLLQAAPASGRLLLDVVVDRPPNISATSMGYPTPGELAQAIKANGYIVGEGSNYPVAGSNLVLGKRLPIRIGSRSHLG